MWYHITMTPNYRAAYHILHNGKNVWGKWEGIKWEKWGDQSLEKHTRSVKKSQKSVNVLWTTMLLITTLVVRHSFSRQTRLVEFVKDFSQ